ncbi:NAD(P)-dependent alcohol dehydrogenase [Chloroflexota bacterium]
MHFHEHIHIRQNRQNHTRICPRIPHHLAEVTGVDSTRKLDIMRSIGADHVIDYTKEDFTKNGQRYDWILDFAAYHSIFDCNRALSPKGIYVMVGGSTRIFQSVVFLGPWISMTGSKKMGVLMHKPNKDLAFMKELFEAGKVVPVIDKRYPLSEVPEALRYFGAGHARGKVVIAVEHNKKPNNCSFRCEIERTFLPFAKLDPHN